MKLTKRIMACLISVSMILSIMPVCTYAATYTPPTPIKGETAEDKAKRADLKYVFLGTSPAANDKSGKGGSYTGTLDGLTKDFAWEEGGLVWIGIQVSNMTRLKDMFNSETVDDNEISGLGSAALTIAYDSDYFTLPVAAQNTASTQSARLLNYPKCYDAVSGVHPSLYAFATEGPFTWDQELSGGAKDSVEPLSLTKMTQTTPEASKISTFKIKITLSSSRQSYDWLLFQNGANPTYGTDWDNAANNPMTDDPFLMAVIPLKMKGATPPADGTKVIEGALSSALMNMSVGATTNGFAYYTSRDGGSGGVTNLHNYFNITSLVDLFPSGVVRQDGIVANLSAADKNLNYKSNENVRTADIVVKKHMDDNSKGDTITEGITYWYGPAGKTNTTEGLTEITNSTAITTGVPSAANTNTLYVKVGNYVAPVKTSADADTTLSVSDAAIDTIAIKNISNTAGWTGQAIAGFSPLSFTDSLSVTVTYDNGKSEDVTKANFGTARPTGANATTLKLFKSDASNAVGDELASDAKFEAVNKQADGKYKNYVQIATADKSKKLDTALSFGAAYDAVTVTTHTDNAVKVNYNANDKFDPTGIVVTTKKLSESAGVKTPYSTTPADRWNTLGLKVVIAADANAAKASSTYADANTTITEAMLTAGNKIFVVVDNDGTKAATEIGTLAKKQATTYTIKTQPVKSYTYPAKLDVDDVVFTAHNSQDATVNNKDYTYQQAIDAGIFDTIKINDGTNDIEVTHNSTVPTYKFNNKTIDFYKGATKVVSSQAIEVTRKSVQAVIDGTPEITKEYNGSTDKAVLTAIVVKTPALTDDPTLGGLAVTGVTFEYKDNGNVDEDKVVIAKGTTLTVNNADFNDKYTLTLPADTTGDITQATLTITEMTVPPVQENATGEGLKVAGTYNFAATNGMKDGDAVVLSYKAVYPSSGKGETPTVTFETEGTGLGLSGTGAANYKLAAMPANIKGSVTNLPLATDWGTAIKKQIGEAEKEIKASANLNETALLDKLPKSGTVVDNKGNEYAVTVVWTKDADPAFAPKGGVYKYTPSITVTNKDVSVEGFAPKATITVTAVSPDLTAAKNLAAVSVPKGTTAADHAALGLAQGGKVTVDGNEIDYKIEWTTPVSDLDTTTAGASKEFEGKIVFPADTTPAWLTIPEATDLVVKQTATVPADVKATGWKEAFNLDKTVPASDAINTKEYLVDAIPAELPTTAKAVDKDGNEYDVTIRWTLKEGTEYTAKSGVYEYTSTITSTDADVSDLTAPTATITVSAVKATIPSSLFSALTVSKNTDNTSFKSLGLDIEVTADLDPAVEGKTFKFPVNWSPVSTSFDTSKSGASQEFTAIIDTSSAPDWLTVELPTDMKKTVSVRRSGSGGGGGVATSTVKFNAGAHGKIVDGKTTQSIKTGSVITELPKVEANEGYTFVGWSQDGGKTIINLADNPIKKATTFTAVYEKAEATPTPTPTEKPQIKTDFTKPYASGYDDGMFLPDDYITRAELASMIARLINGDDIPNSYSASFPDVDNAWYNKYIGFLEDKNVISGYEDGTFRPNNTVTRGEMCAIIARAQRYNIVSIDNMFTDVTDADWAKSYITTLAALNIVSGYNDGTFGTYSPITRAETVAIINRVLEPSTPIITFTPLDIAGHWAEADILLAVNERQVNGTVVATEAPEPTPEATVEPEATAEPEATTAPDATEAPEATAEPTATPAA